MAAMQVATTRRQPLSVRSWSVRELATAVAVLMARTSVQGGGHQHLHVPSISLARKPTPN